MYSSVEKKLFVFVLFIALLCPLQSVAEPPSEEIGVRVVSPAVEAVQSSSQWAGSPVSGVAPESTLVDRFKRRVRKAKPALRQEAFAGHLWFVVDMPPEFSRLIWKYSEEQGTDPYDLAAYVASENSWKYDDFSIKGAVERPSHIQFDYDPQSLGKGGELGIAQIMPYWVRKAREKCAEQSWALGDCESIVEASGAFLAARKRYRDAKKKIRKLSKRLNEKNKGEIAPQIEVLKTTATEAKQEMLDNRTEGMFTPEINFRVAAFVIRSAHESHAKELTPQQAKSCRKARRKARLANKPVPLCADRLHHDWFAHLKLGRKERDLVCGRPGYKKRKFLRVRTSIESFERSEKVWKAARKEYQRYCKKVI
jgi:hypothetical protein